MEQINFSNKRLVSDNGESKVYLINVNGTDVRAYENVKTTQFGFNMGDLAKAFNYETVNEFQASEQWKEFSSQISENLQKNTGNKSDAKIGKVSDVIVDAPEASTTQAKTTGVWKGWAGINGAIQVPTDIFFWGGGDIDEAVEGKCPITFFANGSGWVANQNISWDVLGNLLVRGKIESNQDLNRIVIDPETRSLKMLYGNLVLFELDFFVNGKYAGPRMNLYAYDMETGTVHTTTKLDGGAIEVRKADNKAFFVADAYQSKIWIDADSLPQDRDSAYPKEMYMDGETLKVHRG